jgi:hypothetical protein
MKTKKMYEQALSMLESLPILGLENSDEQSLLNQIILPSKGYCHQLCSSHSFCEKQYAQS